MSIDTAIRHEHEKREQQLHRILVSTGLRPEGSKVEDYRLNKPPEVVVITPAGQRSEAAE
jgi:hypothetical protein